MWNLKPGKGIELRMISAIEVLATLAGMNQGDLAKAMGIPDSQLSEYLSGVRKIGPTAIQQFAKALNVPPEFLMTGEKVSREEMRESIVGKLEEASTPITPATKPTLKEDTRILHLRSITRPVKPLLPANFDHNMGTAPVYLAAAGRPLLVGESVDTAPVPTKFMSKHDDNNFYVLVRGYSMIHSQIDDGDLVFCRKDKVAKTGSIVAATVDGDGVLKILDIREDGSRWLISDTDLLEDYSEYEVKDGVEIHAVAIFVLKSLEKRTKYRV